MIEMARKQLLPATLSYVEKLCRSISTKKQIGLTAVTEEKIAAKLNTLADSFYDSIVRLEEQVNKACAIKGAEEQAKQYRRYVLAEMDIMRNIADEIEVNMPACEWPIPAYSEIIYNV